MKQIVTKIFIAFSIGRATASIDKKSGKVNFFEKQSKLMQKRLKTSYFMNEMHEFEFKSFPKTHEFNLDLAKTHF